MFMKGNFDAYVYVLSPLAKIEYIVDRSTAWSCKEPKNTIGTAHILVL